MLKISRLKSIKCYHQKKNINMDIVSWLEEIEREKSIAGAQSCCAKNIADTFVITVWIKYIL